jgi:hypothetical protein
MDMARASVVLDFDGKFWVNSAPGEGCSATRTDNQQ